MLSRFPDVLTGKLPYIRLTSDPKVIMAIISGNTPIPANYPELPATDPIWGIIKDCWRTDPVKRPTMSEVFDKVRRLLTAAWHVSPS